ncbi:ABC-three component system middle component 8 [Halanaerobium congolense]|uniref:ABC-three component system middle component 8 n=1 Tax=Halanaerobium congolense TaxID=54121 RepID=UPI00159FD745|nr:ABC-three component system middle component 8 [Halanaerobium congolense]
MDDKSIKYHELYNKICNEVDEEINELYLDSLTFLFALGVIEYNKEEDRVVLIK